MGKHSAREPCVTENDDYIAFAQRIIRGIERRAIQDPAMLAQVILLAQQLAEVPNVVIAMSAAQYALDPMRAPSGGEIGKLLGMAKQSVSERRRVGDRILSERMMGEGTIPQRERAARTRAARHAEETMTEWFARREQSAVPSA